jgi:uncharacterized protein YecE (DUF72 family)
MTHGIIRVGIGGWTYEPWRGPFYPAGLPQAREQAYATEHLTSIEINGTYYSSFKPDSWRKWADVAPDDFVYSIKASRFCTNRKQLAEAAGSIEKFAGQGMDALGAKMGPLLWQFMATKAFDPDDFAAFLKLLPPTIGGQRARHAIELRHDSFVDPRFIAMAAEAGAAIVYADKIGVPTIDETTADFVYARLQNSREEEPAGYSDAELDAIAQQARDWAQSGRDVFLYFIAGAKVRAPAAAMALIARLKSG